MMAFTGKRALQIFGAVLALGLLSACGPYVRSDYDNKVNLANYRSYSWAEHSNTERRPQTNAFINPLNEKRLRSAIGAQLAQRGLQPAPDGSTGDVVVSIAIGSRLNERDYAYPHWGFGMGWGGPYGPYGPYPYYGGYYGSAFIGDDDVLYRENRVSVDLYDAKSREAIWHASANTDISNVTGASAQARIDEAVNAMFTKFPVASGTSSGGG